MEAVTHGAEPMRLLRQKALDAVCAISLGLSGMPVIVQSVAAIQRISCVAANTAPVPFCELVIKLRHRTSDRADVKSPTEPVVGYIWHEECEVIDDRALEISGRLGVGHYDPAILPEIVKSLFYRDADAIAFLACVRKAALPGGSAVEAKTGKPAITAAIVMTRSMLRELRLKRVLPVRAFSVQGNVGIVIIDFFVRFCVSTDVWR